MARREIYVDDIDGKEHDDVEPRRFSVGHQSYVIDLSSKNYEQMLKDFSKYTDKATKDSGGSGGSRAPRGSRTPKAPSDAAQIRAWASTQPGMKVSDRGRIHADVRAQWEAAGKP